MNNFDKIAINDKPVEIFLSNKKQIEIENQRKKEEQIYTYTKPNLKYKPHKEKHGKVTIMDQKELNVKNLGANILKSKTISERIFAHLLAGKKLSAKEMATAIDDKINSVRKTVHNLINENKIISDNYLRRKLVGKQYFYYLNEDGLNLKWNEILDKLNEGSNKKKRKTIEFKETENEILTEDFENNKYGIKSIDINTKKESQSISISIKISF